MQQGLFYSTKFGWLRGPQSPITFNLAFRANVV